jgi:hypothetical protein
LRRLLNVLAAQTNLTTRAVAAPKLVVLDSGLAGDRLLAGIVLYTGPQLLPYGDRLRAVPIAALWRV